MAYRGSCHCGAVVFEVDAELPTEAMTCNCSHCRRKGFILTVVPQNAARIVQGASQMTDYYFNKRTISHAFCSICGCQPFGVRKKPGPGGNTMTAVNLRLVPALDLAELKIVEMDGASQ